MINLSLPKDRLQPTSGKNTILKSSNESLVQYVAVKIPTFKVHFTDASLTQISRIVLVNGVGDGITPAESREAAQKTVLARDFPGADVVVFNSVYDQDSTPGYDYFLQKALDAIESLQNFIDHSGAGSDSKRDGVLPKRIVFVALNIGAALVKQVSVALPLRTLNLPSNTV
ncbi:hypothetical protein HC256_007202 [Beauveria bassiana]|nr:hypothetical protein HC256_007202 [Beauveria bassiana]